MPINGIMEAQDGLGWKGPLKLMLFQPMPWARTPSPRPGGSKPWNKCRAGADTSRGTSTTSDFISQFWVMNAFWRKYPPHTHTEQGQSFPGPLQTSPGHPSRPAAHPICLHGTRNPSSTSVFSQRNPWGCLLSHQIYFFAGIIFPAYSPMCWAPLTLGSSGSLQELGAVRVLPGQHRSFLLSPPHLQASFSAHLATLWMSSLDWGIRVQA